MNVLEYLENNILFLDGGAGTLLQEAGLPSGEFPERWNITHPETVTKIHRDYFDAGSNVVYTNTFGANSLKFSPEELREIVGGAVSCARRAKEESTSSDEKFIALDIGPTGKLLKPLGSLSFEDAVEVFAATVRLGVEFGVDLIVIETMNDSYETKAALLAAKENSRLPVFVTNAYGEDGKLMTGADPCAMAALLEGMGADAVGINCSLGPKALAPAAEKLLERCSVPVIFKPNAGLPSVVGGKTVYDVSPEEFARDVFALIEKGVRIAGGCCGTTPEYIKALKKLCGGFSPVPVQKKEICAVSSYTHAVDFGASPVLIGERLNPTGKKLMKEALGTGNMDYILGEAIGQSDRGAHVLDVNVGLPGIDEASVLKKTVEEIQAVCDLPLQIDTSDT
ncbi:MAG: homocysteine S-methyltransferase family protein, partial [Clostridia bacterium]|nr:homocysteine S-methyltransferase family protein [Clostridia bacterium]